MSQAWTSTGTAQTLTAATDELNPFVLPTDCLRVLGLVDSDSAWSIKGTNLLTYDSTATVYYIKQITDTTEFDALFLECLVLALAAKICMPLLRDKVWQEKLEKQLATALKTARLVNLNEVKPEASQTWNEARLGSEED
jgi:hypothetical protein